MRSPISYSSTPHDEAAFQRTELVSASICYGIYYFLKTIMTRVIGMNEPGRTEAFLTPINGTDFNGMDFPLIAAKF